MQQRAAASIGFMFWGFMFLAGCGGQSAQLTDAGTKVRLMKADPPQDCAELGSVSGFAIGPNWRDNIRNKIRNAAAEKGGNYVRLETTDSAGNNLAGTAYRCPEAPGTPAVSAVPSSKPPM